MPDDVTTGELARRLDRLANDVRDDLALLADRLDHKVHGDVYKLGQAAQDDRHQTLAERIAAHERAHTEQAKERSNERRWLVGVLLAPILVLLLGVAVQILLTVLGVL